MSYINLPDDVLDIIRETPYRYYSSLVTPILNNPIYKRCDSLRNFLLANNYPVQSVSRSHIGNNWYYNVRLDNDNIICVDIQLKKLLNVKNVGLVYYDNKNNHSLSVILIDEAELHSKYLQGESLNLNLSSDFIQAIKNKDKAAVIEILTNYSDTIESVDIDFTAGLLSIIAPMPLGMELLVDKLFKKQLSANQYTIMDTVDDELEAYILKYEELLSDGC